MPRFIGHVKLEISYSIHQPAYWRETVKEFWPPRVEGLLEQATALLNLDPGFPCGPKFPPWATLTLLPAVSMLTNPEAGTIITVPIRAELEFSDLDEKFLEWLKGKWRGAIERGLEGLFALAASSHVCNAQRIKAQFVVFESLDEIEAADELARIADDDLEAYKDELAESEVC
jgi:hypothetical protein